MFKKTARLIGCFAFLLAGTRADAQLLGLTEEEYIEKYGVSPVTGEKVEPQKPRPATANDKPATANDKPATANDKPATANDKPATANEKPAVAVSGRLGELQNRSLIASCIPLPIHEAVLQGGVRMQSCTELKGIDVIGYWDGTGRSARWKVSVPRPGNYEMVVSYSFLNLNDGNKQFRIFADGQTRHWNTLPSRPSHYPATSSIIRPAFSLTSGDHWIGIEALSPNYSSLWLLGAFLIPEKACPPGSVVLYPTEGQSLQSGSLFHDATTLFVLGGHFDKTGDGIFWNADIPVTGNYLVEIEYSNRRFYQGRRMKLSVSERNDLYWTLPPTGPLNELPRIFKTQLIDVVFLPKGKRRIALTVEEDGAGALDLFQVRLIPIDDKTAARLGQAVSLPPLPGQLDNKTSSPLTETKPQQQMQERDFPELHEPPPYLHILQEYTRIVQKDSENLRKRFLGALEKMRDKSVKEKNFAAVARIHALIVHMREGGAPPKDLPPNLKRALDAYQFRREKVYYDAKLGYLDALEAMQKSLVSRNDFDQVARIQTYVEQVQTQSPEQLFSKHVAEGGVYMPGTWIQKDKDGRAAVVIVIRPDGTCARYNSIGSTKEPAVLKRITVSQWGSFTVRKKDENVFQFFSFNGPIGTFSFLDKDTFSMPYNGPGIHTRASKQDKPYRLEE